MEILAPGEVVKCMVVVVHVALISLIYPPTLLRIKILVLLVVLVPSASYGVQIVVIQVMQETFNQLWSIYEFNIRFRFISYKNC